MDWLWWQSKTQLERNRFYLLGGVAAVISVWSVMMPTFDPVDNMDLPKVDVGQGSVSNPAVILVGVSNYDSKSWDLPASLPTPQNVKPIIKIPKPIIPVVLQPPPPRPYVMAAPMPTAPASHYDYLGQVTDDHGKTQVFISIDDDPLAMKYGVVYDGAWQLVSMDGQQVRIEHIPSHQIISIPKGGN